MTNLILSGAKSFGSALIRTGGRLAVSYANQAIANAFNNRVSEGPRLETLHIQSSRDGAPMARVFGRARLAGQVIWAAKVREHVTEEKQGGKGGGPRIRQYNYTLSFAIGLCEGEILGVGQIWANGQPLQMAGLNTRLYLGTETQNPDPLIAEVEGRNVPAFRGCAYMVFEDMPIDDFGARLPQLNFEVMRMPARTNGQARLEDLITGVDLIPGSGEFAYGTTITEERLGPGTSRPINMNNLAGVADIELALDQLQAQLPKCKAVTLVVSWFGTDLRAAQCEIFPGVESVERGLSPENWHVNGHIRATAHLISMVDGRPVFGGTPSDAAVVEAVQSLQARGFKVSLYPFILMDIPAGNTNENPYGGNSQPAYPWRGRITCDPAPMASATVDQTANATSQVQTFFGAAQANDFTINGVDVAFGGSENSYRRMILHYAHLMKAIGGVHSFIIGSEMRGLTTVRGNNDSYPAVDALKTLAFDIRSIVGLSTKLTYAADWSEYFGHHPQDGSGDVRFHLDPLWADANIDAVGIDAYFPLSDWRDGEAHLDKTLAPDIYDLDYLTANIEGGEGYDWYYVSPSDRDNQIRTDITDGLAAKPWVYRNKDIRNWWGELHYERVNGQELPNPTAWVPQSKPIWFTEIGCPAIDKGANQPNVFWDPKSSESYAPYYSSGLRDDLIQRRYIEAFLGYWQNEAHNPTSNLYAGHMVDMNRTHIWCWDARPYPDFPARLDVWSDGGNWQTGHWVNGRTGLVSLADIISALCVGTGAASPDVNRVHGMVTGYVIDRPMSARSALSPLANMYQFDLTEQAQGLAFASKGVQTPILLNMDGLVRGPQNGAVTTLSRRDIESRPKEVRLHFIEQGKDYQAGVETARDLLAETVRILDVQAPVVLDRGQAKTMANGLLLQARLEGETLAFSVPPSWLALEPGDVVEVAGQEGTWQITSSAGLGGRNLQGRRSSNMGVRVVNGVEPMAVNSPTWVSPPEAIILDMAGFDESLRQGPLIGAILSPWVETAFTAAQGEEITTSAPVVVGVLLNDFKAGPVGRYDHSQTIDVKLAGVMLSSLTEHDFLGGGNLLAVETSKGWEIFQCQNAELIAAHTYRLDTFLRGLYGTDADMDLAVLSGARVVYLKQGFEDLPLGAALRGSQVEISVSSIGRTQGQSFDFSYLGRHLRPLSPVHLKAKKVGGIVNIFWIRRTRIGGDDWASLDVPIGEESERYEVDFLSGEVVLATKSTNTPFLNMDLSELETLFGAPLGEIKVSVSQISQSYGRGAATTLVFTLD